MNKKFEIGFAKDFAEILHRELADSGRMLSRSKNNALDSG